MNIYKLFKILVLLLLLAAYAMGFARPIEFSNTDIGRHLQNGSLFLNQNILPQTNFYSYTHPDFPVVNHHWGSGVIFFIIAKYLGFTYLSLLYLLLCLGAVILMIRHSLKHTDFWPLASAMALAWPIAISRTEIRPEGFSYLLAALYYYLLWQVKDKRLSLKWLYLLPFLQVIWINLHIYFVIGIFIVFMFFLETLISSALNKCKTKNSSIMSAIFYSLSGKLSTEDQQKFRRTLANVLMLLLITCLLNPSGIKGALEPFVIFTSYGYRIVENQSLFFMQRLFPSSELSYFSTLLIISALSIATYLILASKQKESISIAELLINLTFGIMATLALRNFTLFGLFIIPLLAKSWTTCSRLKPSLISLPLVAALILALIYKDIAINKYNRASIGLHGKTLAPLEFFQNNDLQGPIFNNYDIGAMLIYGLYPLEKVFVDNRPEAYPQEFFNNDYIPYQEDEKRWKEAEEKYKFNVIFFYRRDNTPWGQQFLINRVYDKTWAPVFVDHATIILLKRNALNEALIQRFALPLTMFQVKPN
ncbi:MAG: hypothetical protein IT292_03910 [Deltaproteobacteria bacterium]|nr:hypothetical protein [Deltaproteobacteria bacterium]